MNTHESYVSLETARLLKEAGFDWEVSHWYADKPDDKELYEDYAKPMNANQYMDPYHYYQAFSAPTIEVAQRWLREVKGIHVYVISYRQNNQDKISCYCHKVYEFTQGWEFNYFSYEAALEAGIKKALEMILEKGEYTNRPQKPCAICPITK